MVWQFLIKFNMQPPCDTTRYLLKKNENIFPKRDLHKNVDSNFIHNSQKQPNVHQ